jgi:hypothetical protein
MDCAEPASRESCDAMYQSYIRQQMRTQQYCQVFTEHIIKNTVMSIEMKRMKRQQQMCTQLSLLLKKFDGKVFRSDWQQCLHCFYIKLSLSLKLFLQQKLQP